METVTSTLSVLPNTKDEVKAFANKLRIEILNGEVDPLMITKVKKAFEMVFDSIKDDLRTAAVEVAEKYGNGKFGLHGSEYQVKEMGVRYDYDGCGDPIYKKLKDNIKSREAMLKSLSEPFKYIEPETGEEITINPPVKSSTTTVQVTL
jgi:hypothetical protein